ncbi:hypothetical protein [Lentzea aerocolonigenes]|uniref:hypothetical protein n=1 Tax=Lentzea aerocolonigenes TaxID=68170 RepID=UPI000B1C6520|nr:hypothetical protein [Lentzea aerocolonigenes]
MRYEIVHWYENGDPLLVECEHVVLLDRHGRAGRVHLAMSEALLGPGHYVV